MDMKRKLNMQFKFKEDGQGLTNDAKYALP